MRDSKLSATKSNTKKRQLKKDKILACIKKIANINFRHGEEHILMHTLVYVYNWSFEAPVCRVD